MLLSLGDLRVPLGRVEVDGNLRLGTLFDGMRGRSGNSTTYFITVRKPYDGHLFGSLRQLLFGAFEMPSFLQPERIFCWEL